MASPFRVCRQLVRRRVVIGAFAAVANSYGDIPVENVRRRIEDALSVISAAMTELHGGQWTAHVDHDAGFVLISPQRAPVRPLG